MRCVALLLALLAQAAGAAGAEVRAGAAFFRQVESVLTKDEAFYALHRGYVDYLAARPEALAAEQAWWDVLIEPSVGAAATALDEALMADPTASAALDTYYDLLARDPELRTSVESLQRIEFTERPQRELVAPALEALRANPDLALRLLQGGGEGGALAEPLQAFGRLLQERPGLVQELGAAFGALGESPLAQTRLLPWWQQLTQRGAVPAAYSALAARFAEAPRRFWAWHARELAWASDAQARDWARYLYRKARRLEGMGDAYTHYLRAIHADESARAAAESRYEAAAVPSGAFPPLPAPPVLAPKMRPSRDDATPRLTPKMPARPNAPTAPERPAEPTRPRLEMRKAMPRTATPDQSESGRGRRSEESGD